MAISGLAPPATVTRSARLSGWLAALSPSPLVGRLPRQRAALSRKGRGADLRPAPCTLGEAPCGSQARALSPSCADPPAARIAGRPCHCGRGERADVLALPDQPGAQVVGLGDGGRQADGLQARRERAQAGEAEREQVAALVGHQRVQLVEDDGVEIGEEAVGVGGGEQQRRLLRRGQQDVRRVQLLALALVQRGVAGARLEPHRRGRSRRPAARGCGRYRRQAPSAARRRGCGCRGRAGRVRPAGARAGETRLGRKPASVLPAPVGAISSVERPALRLGEQLELVRPRRPAARGEPGGEGRGQQARRVGDLGAGGHPVKR